jgi:hypothetical protein
MSATMRVKAVVSFEGFIAFVAVELAVGEMCLHVSGKKRFLDELLRAIKALELSFRCVIADVIVALILVLEQNTANMTGELLDVGVFKVVNFQR